ncbi:MAG: hypothetical protein ACTHMM_18345 [Agriterribacter sp.]
MNLNEVITESVNKTIEEKLPEMVNTKVSKMIDEVLTDIFRSYSDTSKEIKKKIEEKLDVNLQQFDLIDYNHLISKAVADKVGALTQEEAIKPLMEMLQNTIGYTDKKEITLSEIHEHVINLIKKDSIDDSGEILFDVERNHSMKWVTVKIGEESDEKPTVEFLISEERGDIFIFRNMTHWEKMGEMTKTKMVSLGGVEEYIFRLYSAKVKIKVDQTSFDNDWSKYDY